MSYINIAQRIFNEPLMADERKLQVILGVLGPRLHFEAPQLTAAATDGAASEPPRRGVTAGVVPLEGRMAEAAPVDVGADGATEERQDSIMVISITGTLVNRIAMEPPSSFASYERLAGFVQQAAADPKVKGIMLRIESYGGEVAGAFDVADLIRAAAEQKPVWCSVDDNAFSAAYLLACQTQKIYVTRTGGVGSVGVIAIHYDYSKWEEKQGIKPTAIFAGSKKNWFSPDEALDPKAAAWLKQRVMDNYEMFVSYVARGRSMDEAAIKATEAGVYEGQQGIDIGFADSLGTFTQAMEEFRAELRSQRSTRIGIGGSAAKSTKGGRAAIMLPTQDNAAENAAIQSNQAPPLDTAAIRTEAIKAERARVGAILSHAEAKGREQLARTLALESDMDAEAAGRVMAAAPKANTNDALAAAMAGVHNPAVGAGAGDGTSETDEVARIAALHTQLKGGQR